MMLTKSIKKAIIAHAIADYPREACGVIVGKEYIPCTNIAADNAQFEICPIDLVGVSKEGAIRAYVHSHPDGSCQPSMPDRVQMNLHDKPWVITNGIDVELHKPDGYQAPLLGREYHHGLMDCYTLVKDYYQRELGITLGEYQRDDIWWESADSKPLYLDNFRAEGFVEVDTIQKHDLILCRLGRTEHVNHALVFIGDGKLKSERTDDVIGDCLVLHHPYNRESLREIYGEQWQRRAAVIIRHKSLIK
ncbi:MAG: phage tail protein [Psychrobacter sp. B29-1]|uniref:C40 family peptidase n=1 Tax=Psychrobacter sp. B29-1 TaxID=1867800 RepID=UPI00086B639B|nr:Mov34/MPN/PAD-1 family protein [Psychrobacter sp. B29-1]OEH69152.1 MAG: phage tail protein [Psychrobacter sp. B29-1]